VLETACEYIEELNEMSTQFNQLKLSKELLGSYMSTLLGDFCRNVKLKAKKSSCCMAG
jgi:hypothetical protein